jgi:hypothetical protein
MNAVIDGNSGETTSLSALDPSLSHMRTPADARRIAYVVYSHPVEHDIPSQTSSSPLWTVGYKMCTRRAMEGKFLHRCLS